MEKEEKVEKGRGITIDTSHVSPSLKHLDAAIVASCSLGGRIQKVFVNEQVDLVVIRVAKQDLGRQAKQVPKRKLHRGDIAAFAEHLVDLSTKELKQLAKVLEEEYGIVPAKAASVNSSTEECLVTLRTKPRKKDYYVPKKVGRVNNKPKG